MLEGVDAVGKHLLLRFEGGVVLRSHLRMNGRWRLDPRGRERRGLPWLVLRGREWEATQWNGPVLTLEKRAVRRLGPDLLADGTEVAAVVARMRLADQSLLVGEALVDQRLVAGIGNMWLAEALWHARVSPWRRLADVSDDELAEALTWAREHMRAAVRGSRSPRSGLSAGRPAVSPLRDAGELARARRHEPHGVLVQCLPAVGRNGVESRGAAAPPHCRVGPDARGRRGDLGDARLSGCDTDADDRSPAEGRDDPLSR